jgi:hypothetical protein
MLRNEPVIWGNLPQRSSLCTPHLPDASTMYLQLFLHQYTTTRMGCAVSPVHTGGFHSCIGHTSPPTEVTTDYL